jgi:hypothetical protein
MAAYQTAIKHVGDVSAYKQKYWVLSLNIAQRELTITGFLNSEKANDSYSALEEQTSGDAHCDSVLVAAESLGALRRAYPNYFADTTSFLESLRKVIGQAARSTNAGRR